MPYPPRRPNGLSHIIAPTATMGAKHRLRGDPWLPDQDFGIIDQFAEVPGPALMQQIVHEEEERAMADPCADSPKAIRRHFRGALGDMKRGDKLFEELQQRAVWYRNLSVAVIKHEDEKKGKYYINLLEK